jgi:LPXTG-site transpeptidase (sortase) family protein
MFDSNISFYHPPKTNKKSWIQFSWKKIWSDFYTGLIHASLLIGFLVSLGMVVVLFSPDLFFQFIPVSTVDVAEAKESSLGGSFEDGALYAPISLPAYNEYLPDGNWLVIPKIGVRTQINEASVEDHEEALKKGVWRTSDFAKPVDTGFPMILAAHRFGYLVWTNDFRKKNSFYNLDQLEVGDTFEIIWEKRKFTYEIYQAEDGEEIVDYDADVILYTCKFLNSSERYFRYARRVEW